MITRPTWSSRASCSLSCFAACRSSWPSSSRRACGFLPWLAASEEQGLDLPAGNFTHFDNVVGMEGGQVRLLRRPEELVFVSAKTASPAEAPWLRL
jgi:hypothetical protein